MAVMTARLGLPSRHRHEMQTVVEACETEHVVITLQTDVMTGTLHCSAIDLVAFVEQRPLRLNSFQCAT